VPVSPIPTGRLAAVLFDMDGTLVDSEKIWDISLADTARWLGGELSVQARESMVGSHMARSVTILHDDLGVDADPEASAAYLTERTAELFSGPLPWRPGARELLDAVAAAGIPAALVTATHRSLTLLALNTIGAHRFAAIVCGDEVSRGKPDPEPYLRAAQLLDVNPVDCLVIEDSVTGVTAGERSGAAVLGVPSEVPLAQAPTRTIRDTLVGLGVADLRQLVAEHNSHPGSER
jgi:HAD superfamily hydrolase (TIGR01509 family)